MLRFPKIIFRSAEVTIPLRLRSLRLYDVEFNPSNTEVTSNEETFADLFASPAGKPKMPLASSTIADEPYALDWEPTNEYCVGDSLKGTGVADITGR